MKKNKKMVLIIGLVLISVVFVFGLLVKKLDERWVAYYVGDLMVDPIVFQEQLYFPINEYPYGEEWDFEENMELQGYITIKDVYEKRGTHKNVTDYLWYIYPDQVWIDNRYSNQEYVQVLGDSSNMYAKTSCLEECDRMQQLLEQYSSYVLMQNDCLSGNKYLFPEELILELEQEFGECSYDVNDFKEMVEVYYIFVNPYSHYAGGASGNRHYIATIFVDKDNKFYYCNSKNLINDELSKKINEILRNGEVIVEID